MTRVCDSQRFIGGPEVEGLERELCDTLGVPARDRPVVGHRRRARGADGARHRPRRRSDHADLFVLRHRRLRGRALGATPVLVDIEPGTFNIDTDAAIAAITPRTKAIIPVHLFGQAAELAPIVDAAQPARHRGDRGRGAGDRLHVSRHAGRHVRRDRLLLVLPEQEPRRVRRRAASSPPPTPRSAKKLRLIRKHGMEPKYYHHLVGANFRLDALQAAVLRVKLPHLAGVERRRAAPTPRATARCSPTPA